jgi:hypothetical protein
MHLRPTIFRSRQLFTLFMVAIVATSCGSSDSDADPTPTAETTANTTTSQGELTVQELTDRINAAWSDVSALRVTSASGPIPAESGDGSSTPQGSFTVEEWTEPNNRRITEVVDGEIVNEQVYVDGAVYMKGSFVGSAVAPEVGSETWITLDPSVIPSDTPVGNRITYLTREPASPFAGMAPEILTQAVRESGDVQVGDRTCTLYTFGDPDNTGEEIRYEIALDENDIPCQVVQRGGGFQNSSVYQVNSNDILIVGPDAGTPVSGTPEG